MRRTGRTTLQIGGAPKGAVFVTPNSAMLEYARDIAHALGRLDITFKPQSFLDNLEGWRGQLVVDHSIFDDNLLTDWQHQQVMAYQQRTGGQ